MTITMSTTDLSETTRDNTSSSTSGSQRKGGCASSHQLRLPSDRIFLELCARRVVTEMLSVDLVNPVDIIVRHLDCRFGTQRAHRRASVLVRQLDSPDAACTTILQMKYIKPGWWEEGFFFFYRTCYASLYLRKPRPRKTYLSINEKRRRSFFYQADARALKTHCAVFVDQQMSAVDTDQSTQTSLTIRIGIIFTSTYCTTRREQMHEYKDRSARTPT